MSFPGHDHANPQRVSAAVNTAGFAQDVVVATSRLIHGQSLVERDRQALGDCRELLRRMLSTDVNFSRSGERQLASTNTVALLREAGATHPDVSEDLANAANAIDHLLAGERDANSVQQLRKLRQIFLTVGEVNLAAMTRPEPGQEGPDGWTRLIVSSLY